MSCIDTECFFLLNQFIIDLWIIFINLIIVINWRFSFLYLLMDQIWFLAFSHFVSTFFFPVAFFFICSIEFFNFNLCCVKLFHETEMSNHYNQSNNWSHCTASFWMGLIMLLSWASVLFLMFTFPFVRLILIFLLVSFCKIFIFAIHCFKKLFKWTFYFWFFFLKFITCKDTSWECFSNFNWFASTFNSSWFAPWTFINSITSCLICICACFL